MLSIGLAYFVTLCLFPGIQSEIRSCSLGSWMPVLLMALFNLCDLIGKVRLFSSHMSMDSGISYTVRKYPCNDLFITLTFVKTLSIIHSLSKFVCLTRLNDQTVLQVLSSRQYDWHSAELCFSSLARMVLVPLTMFCAMPRFQPLLSSEFWPFLLAGLLGLSNGVLGCVPMMEAPKRVKKEDRELAGDFFICHFIFFIFRS